MNLFTQDAAVREFGAAHLHIVGAFYGLYGFGAGIVRCLAVRRADVLATGWQRCSASARSAGRWVCVHVLQTSASGFFAVVAMSLAVDGSIIAGANKFGRLDAIGVQDTAHTAWQSTIWRG